MGLKRSIIQNHVKSTKHMAWKMRLERKEARERDTSEALHRHDKTVNQKGASLPASQRVYRVKVAMAFLKAGVPFEKVDCFRELLEENVYRLVDKRHQLDLVPFILKEEQAYVKAEIPDKIFQLYSTAHHGLGRCWWWWFVLSRNRELNSALYVLSFWRRA